MSAHAPQLNRAVFVTSRELEYFTAKELTLQTGHEPERWPEVALKELVDNGLDACEGAGIAPEITVTLTTDSITVADNGLGLPASVIESVLDYSVRASSKDAYISPTRGAQGNALKTILAIPFVLNGEQFGQVEIESRGTRHTIEISIDRIAQKPEIVHRRSSSVVKNGTCVKVGFSTLTNETAASFLQLLTGYSLFNPHATFTLKAGGKATLFRRTASEWRKWLPNEPTSPHWYTGEQLRDLIAAYIANERKGNAARTVREFVAEFRGLSATAKQKAILTRLNLSGVFLRDLVKGGDVDNAIVNDLLAAMRAESKPVKPQALGIIGEERFKAWFEGRGIELSTFRYKRTADLDDKTGLPFVAEIAFAVRKDGGARQLMTGINWSPALIDPFRSLSRYGVGLDGLLNSLHINQADPVTFVLHLACPHLNYTDRGKSSLEVL
jgi:DNA topoisomerase VI subunit B